MISRFLQRTKSAELPTNNQPLSIALDEQSDGLIYVSPKSLIALRHAAESLPLKLAKVRALQSGEYYSPFKGRGMEFDEVRLYQPGDDIRTLDWRVTARTGKTHTKLFREERERSVLLWVDYRQPMFFATQGAFKSVVASKAAALLAWSAAHQGDRLGAFLFSEEKHHELRPQRSKISVMHLLQQLSEHTMRAQQVATQQSKVNPSTHDVLDDALRRLRRVAKPGSLLILFSDFRDFSAQSESHVMQLAKQNDVILVFVYDPLEANLPPSGYYRISDFVSTVTIDTNDNNIRQSYQARFQTHVNRLHKISRRHHVHFLPLSTSDDLLKTLQRGLGIVPNATRK